MSRFRKVEAGTWGDSWFKGLTQDGKMLWMYLLTGPEATCLPGLIVAGRAHLAEALDWEPERFDEAWAEVSSGEEPRAYADWKARVIFLPNAARHNVPQNPNTVMAWRDAARLVPECPLRTAGLASLAALKDGRLAWYPIAFEKAFGFHVDKLLDDSIEKPLKDSFQKKVLDQVPVEHSPAPASSSLSEREEITERIAGGVGPPAPDAPVPPKSPKAPKPTKCSPDFQPDAATLKVLEGEDVPTPVTLATVAEFVEYWTEGKGMGKRHPNWQIVFRGNVRKLRDMNRLPSPRQRPPLPPAAPPTPPEDTTPASPEYAQASYAKARANLDRIEADQRTIFDGPSQHADVRIAAKGTVQ